MIGRIKKDDLIDSKAIAQVFKNIAITIRKIIFAFDEKKVVSPKKL